MTVPNKTVTGTAACLPNGPRDSNAAEDQNTTRPRPAPPRPAPPCPALRHCDLPKAPPGLFLFLGVHQSRRGWGGFCGARHNVHQAIAHTGRCSTSLLFGIH